MDEIYLSREGYEKLRLELEHLQKVKRREFSKAIGEARAHGDLSENAEYDAAKEAQARNEEKIAELQDKLSRVRIMEDLGIPSDQALIGATLKLQDLSSGEEIEYTLVAEEEADFDRNMISVTSPLGSGFIGHKVSEVVEIKVPAGVLKYKIIEITRK